MTNLSEVILGTGNYYNTRLKELEVEELLYTLKERFGYHIILLCHESIDELCHHLP